MPFAGIGNLEYFNRHFVAAQMQAQQRIGDKHFILLRVAAGQHSSHLKDILKEKTVLGVQASYYFNTIFGPLGTSLGYSNYTKKVNAFINLGYVF